MYQVKYSTVVHRKVPIIIKEIYLSKALTCMKFFVYMYKQKMLFKETDTFGHIVV